MKYLFSDILKAKISASTGKRLLSYFPSNAFSSLFINSFVNVVSKNGMALSLQMVNSALNNQRFNQQFNQQQQQNRMT